MHIIKRRTRLHRRIQIRTSIQPIEQHSRPSLLLRNINGPDECVVHAVESDEEARGIYDGDVLGDLEGCGVGDGGVDDGLCL